MGILGRSASYSPNGVIVKAPVAVETQIVSFANQLRVDREGLRPLR